MVAMSALTATASVPSPQSRTPEGMACGSQLVSFAEKANPTRRRQPSMMNAKRQSGISEQ
jgi:hypothetical protein